MERRRRKKKILEEEEGESKDRKQIEEEIEVLA